MLELSFRTERRSQLLDITREVREAVSGQDGIRDRRLRSAHDCRGDDQRARRPCSRARSRDGPRAHGRGRLVVAASRAGRGERSDARSRLVDGVRASSFPCGMTASSRSEPGRGSSSASSTGRASGRCTSPFSASRPSQRRSCGERNEGLTLGMSFGPGRRVTSSRRSFHGYAGRHGRARSERGGARAPDRLARLRRERRRSPERLRGVRTRRASPVIA